jgi:hypothetical protein
MQAQKNYELLLRITDRQVCNAVWDEVLAMALRPVQSTYRMPTAIEREETIHE